MRTRMHASLKIGGLTAGLLASVLTLRTADHRCRTTENQNRM